VEAVAAQRLWWQRSNGGNGAQRWQRRWRRSNGDDGAATAMTAQRRQWRWRRTDGGGSGGGGGGGCPLPSSLCVWLLICRALTPPLFVLAICRSPQIRDALLSLSLTSGMYSTHYQRRNSLQTDRHQTDTRQTTV
jgi:hypothetical protein